MYFCSEICTAALKYVLLHQNIYCHSEICYPDGMHTLANHHHTVHYGHRPTNGSITASYRPHVHLPSSYRVFTVCHRLYPPGEKFWVCPKLSPGPAGRKRATNVFTDRSTPRRVPSPCSTVRTKLTTRWHTVGLAGAMWQLHNAAVNIAPAKPNGPIPFDLNDKRCNLTGQIVFFYLSPGPYRSIPGLYRVLPGLVPNSPSSYSSSLSFSPCHHRVHTACSEICHVALNYILLL